MEIVYVPKVTLMMVLMDNVSNVILNVKLAKQTVLIVYYVKMMDQE